ncbi:MAG: phage terminase large subunit [Cyanophyceae cyanobacterium]
MARGKGFDSFALDMLTAQELARPKQRPPIPSLSEFLRQSWHVLEPETPLEWNWHIEVICLHVEQILLDWRSARRDPKYKQRANKFLINVPPGSMKSRIVSVCAPAWFWLLEPSWTGLFLSSNPRVAERDATFCRDLIRSDWYRKTFQPDWEIRKKKDAVSNFWNTRGGRRRACGFTSKATGIRADAIFIDDPHDAQEVDSPVKRQAVLDKWDSSWSSRINSPAISVRLLIMQRLAQNDLSGHVYATNDWHRLIIRQRYELGDKETVFGWKDPRVEEKQLMHPARFPEDVVDSFKRELGEHRYAGQHQQRPVPREGGTFKREWFIHQHPPPLEELDIFQSWDTASKDKATNCPWVCTTWGVKGQNMHLLHVHRDRHQYSAGRKVAFSLALHWKPQIILIEDASTGTVLIQDFKQGIPTGDGPQDRAYIRVIPIRPSASSGSKVTRAESITATIEAGRVILPVSAPWLNTFMEEITLFPASQFSDQVDSLSQFVNWGQFRFSEPKSNSEKPRDQQPVRRRSRGGLLH